jgi:hypothetical protein
LRFSSRWRERTTCSLRKRADACSLRKRVEGLFSMEESRRRQCQWVSGRGTLAACGGGGGRGYSLASSPAGVWRFGGDGGVKSGSGNLVTACHDLLLFVLPNSSSNQPSNFALRILVGEMSPRGIADLLIYNENGNRPQRIRGQSQCHSGLRTLALRSLFSCASLCTHRIRERRL